MSGEAPEPAEPVSASELYDEIEAMFAEALAGEPAAADAVETGRGGD
jgi:hypothetical protein